MEFFFLAGSYLQRRKGHDLKMYVSEERAVYSLKISLQQNVSNWGELCETLPAVSLKPGTGAGRLIGK